MFDIVQFIEENGPEKVRLLIPMRPVHSVFGIFGFTSTENAESLMLCSPVFDRYERGGNYKIEVQAEVPEFGRRSFYVSDLNSLVQDGNIRVFIEENAVEP